MQQYLIIAAVVFAFLTVATMWQLRGVKLPLWRLYGLWLILALGWILTSAVAIIAIIYLSLEGREDARRDMEKWVKKILPDLKY